jgi:hypothetical protein
MIATVGVTLMSVGVIVTEVVIDWGPFELSCDSGTVTLMGMGADVVPSGTPLIGEVSSGVVGAGGLAGVEPAGGWVV